MSVHGITVAPALFQTLPENLPISANVAQTGGGVRLQTDLDGAGATSIELEVWDSRTWTTAQRYEGIAAGVWVRRRREKAGESVMQTLLLTKTVVHALFGVWDTFGSRLH